MGAQEDPRDPVRVLLSSVKISGKVQKEGKYEQLILTHQLCNPSCMGYSRRAPKGGAHSIPPLDVIPLGNKARTPRSIYVVYLLSSTHLTAHLTLKQLNNIISEIHVASSIYAPKINKQKLITLLATSGISWMIFIIHDSRKISPKYEYSKIITENTFIACTAS